MPTRDEVLAAVSKKFKQTPWDCPKCGKHFDDYQSLRVHGEREHHINRAGRAAGEMGDLVAHYVNLTDNKIKARNGKYHCPECNAPFADPRPLGIHRSEAHGFIGMVHMQILAQPGFIPAHVREQTKKRTGRPPKNALAVAEPTTNAVIVPPAEPPMEAEVSPTEDMLAEYAAAHGAIQLLQNSLNLVNMALALQKMPPGQATQLLGTLGALGQMHRPRAAGSRRKATE